MNRPINIDNLDNGASTIIDLEKLKVQYKALLIQYKQAVLNYVNYLKQESLTPCGIYRANSTNINQECYNDIWKKGGCTQPPRQMSSQTSGMTLNDWILDTFNWATWNDSQHRKGCYGIDESPYLIIGVALDNNLAVRSGLYGGWSLVNDNSNANIISICTGSDGKTIYGITVNHQIVTKSRWDASTWSAPIISKSCTPAAPCSNVLLDTRVGAQQPTALFTSGGKNYCCAEKCFNKNEADCGNNSFAGCSSGYYQTYVDAPNTDGNSVEITFLSIAQAPDGSFVAVGTDHTLWVATDLQSCWTNVATSELENAVCIGPNGRVIVANGVDLYYKDSYKNLQNQVWKYGGPGCCQDITVAPDGKLMDAGGCQQYGGSTDNQIWTQESYMNLNGAWKGPYEASCCIKSLTTVINDDYSNAGYSTATAPNYDINKPSLTALQGNAFWGTGNISLTSKPTLEDCKAACSNTKGCSGATFNPTAHGQPLCWLNSGESAIIPALADDFAIVPEGKQLLEVVEKLNTQLTNVNTQIQSITKSGQTIYDTQTYQRKLQTTELVSQFVSLAKERKKIEELLNNYQTLDQNENAASIKINQNYYSFFLLLALVIIIIIVLTFYIFPAKKQSLIPSFQGGGGKLDNKTNYLLFFIVIILIFIPILSRKK